jgi:hypothetical protein
MSKKAVWKFAIPAPEQGQVTIEIPSGSSILDIEGTRLYALVDPEAATKLMVTLKVVRTGDEIDPQDLLGFAFLGGYWHGSHRYHVFAPSDMLGAGWSKKK